MSVWAFKSYDPEYVEWKAVCRRIAAGEYRAGHPIWHEYERATTTLLAADDIRRADSPLGSERT